MNALSESLSTMGTLVEKLFNYCNDFLRLPRFLHKAIVDVCPPFRPILSAIGTPTYEIAKFIT